WMVRQRGSNSCPPARECSRRGESIMLSRVAETLFWMSRYLERAENVARLLDIGLYLELDAASRSLDDGSAPVAIALKILACGDAFRSTHPAAERTAVLGFLTFDRANPQSILSMIGRARDNARATQETGSLHFKLYRR